MILVDIGTTCRDRGRIAHGIRRVERSIVAALLARDRPDVGFFRYDRRRGEIVLLAPDQVRQILAASAVGEARRELPAAWRSVPLLQAGRRAELWFRLRVRDPLRRVLGGLRRPSRQHLPPGTTLVFLSGIGTGPERPLLRRFRRRDGAAVVALCHDVLPVRQAQEFRPGVAIAATRAATDFMLAESDLVLCNSQHTAATLARYAASRGFATPPLDLLPLGQGLDGAPGPPPEGLRPGSFVLAVGGLEPRKNHRIVIEAWTQLARAGRADLPLLVIAGVIGRVGAPLAGAVAADPHASRVVRLLPNVTDGQLQWLYGNCRFTVFPSLYEGFGLPVSESLFYGKPCIASSTTAMPEASQGLAIHLDPLDGAAWRVAIESLLDEQRLRAAEAEIAARFRPTRWEDTADALVIAVASLRAPAPGVRSAPAPEAIASP